MAVKKALSTVVRAKENQHVEFWLTHCFLMASTVLGVYLAASTGFDTALRFDQVHALREGHNIRRALLEELEDNVALVDEWLEMWRAGRNGELRGSDQSLDLFIWNAMAEHPQTFAIEGEVLTGVRRYYRTVRELGEKLDLGRFGGGYAQSLGDATAQVKDELVPHMRNGLAESAAKLAEHGVAVLLPAARPTAAAPR